MAPPCANRVNIPPEGRPLRRREALAGERFFGWLGAYRWALMRWEVKGENYLGFVN